MPKTVGWYATVLRPEPAISIPSPVSVHRPATCRSASLGTSQSWPGEVRRHTAVIPTEAGVRLQRLLSKVRGTGPFAPPRRHLSHRTSHGHSSYTTLRRRARASSVVKKQVAYSYDWFLLQDCCLEGLFLPKRHEVIYMTVTTSSMRLGMIQRTKLLIGFDQHLPVSWRRIEYALWAKTICSGCTIGVPATFARAISESGLRRSGVLPVNH